MGVRGFASYVRRQFVGKNFKHKPIPSSSVLLIDLSSFVYFLFDKLPNEESLPQYLGNYKAFSSLFLKILECLEARNIEVIAYVDGTRRSSFKARTIRSRCQSLRTQYSKLWQFHTNIAEFKAENLESEGSISSDLNSKSTPKLDGPIDVEILLTEPTIQPRLKSECTGQNLSAEGVENESQKITEETKLSEFKYPYPVMLLQSAIWCLQQKNCRIVKLNCEADEILIQDCNKIRARGEDAFILSSDSDFFFAKGCAFIPLRYFMPFCKRGPSGIIFTRKKLAESMNITEHSLIILAILSGNDYTNCFEETRKAIIRNTVPSILNVYKWIIRVAHDMAIDLTQFTYDYEFLNASVYSQQLYNNEIAKVRLPKTEPKKEENIIFIPKTDNLGKAPLLSLKEYCRRASLLAMHQNYENDLSQPPLLELKAKAVKSCYILCERGFISEQSFLRITTTLNKSSICFQKHSEPWNSLVQGGLCYQFVCRFLMDTLDRHVDPSQLFNPFEFFNLKGDIHFEHDASRKDCKMRLENLFYTKRGKAGKRRVKKRRNGGLKAPVFLKQ